MSTTTSSHFLQQTFLLATGRAASDAVLTQLSALVQEEGGAFRLAADPINRLFGSLAAINGDAATLKAIAFNGLGLSLTEAQASLIHAQLFAAGIDTWAKFFEFCIGLQNSIGQVLDNRADAAQGFNATLAASGKAALFSGETVNTAVANLLQNIGSSAASLSSGNTGLGILAGKLTSAGILSAVVDGYVAGATVFVDANGDGQLNAGEYSTSTDASGKFVLPGNGAAGAVIAFGGTDLFTGKAFQGSLSALAGSTLVNPFTTMVQTLVSTGYSDSIAQAVSAVQKGLGLPLGINLLTYDAMAVLARSTATASQKAEALFVQALSLQLANVLTQLTATIDAAHAVAGSTGSSAGHVASVLASALSSVSASGTLALTGTGVLTEIVKAAAFASGAAPLADVAGQIALVIAASNASAAAAINPTQLSQAAVISQGAATDALASGARSGSFDGAVVDFTGSHLTTKLNAATPGLIAPGMTTQAAWVWAAPNFAFVVTETDGVVTFSGSATGAISVAWEGAPGNSVAIFSRAGAAANVMPDFSGTATARKVSLAVGQTLSGTASQLKGLIIEGAGAVVLTDTSASAADLLAIDAASTLTVDAASVLNLTGTAEQIAGVVRSMGITKAANLTATIDAGTAAAADLKFIDAMTTAAVNASAVINITGTAADVGAVISAFGILKSSGYAITLTDVEGTAMTAASLNTLRGKTLGIVTVANPVAITGTALELTAALVTAENLLAAVATITVTGSATTAQVNAIAARTTGAVKATISATLSNLSELTETNNAYTITVSDAAGTAMTAWALTTLRGQTTGVVTVTNAVVITGTAAEVAAALVTAETLVIAGSAKVTITGDVTVEQVNAIAARTRGAVTATVVDTIANLATLEAGNVYTMTVTDAAGTGVTAASLSTLGGKTTGVVTVANAVVITGTSAEVTAALLTGETLVVASTAAVTITGSVTATLVNSIATKTTGMITAAVTGGALPTSVSGTLATLGSLTLAGSVYPITVTDAAGTVLTASALSALGGKTTGLVTVANSVVITGTAAELRAALVADDTLVVAATAKVTLSGTVTAAEVNDIAARTSGAVTANVSDSLSSLTGLAETNNVYTLTVTDLAGTFMNAWELSALGGKSTGVVTVANAAAIAGTAAEVSVALVTPDTLVVAGTATVTINDPDGTELSASTLKAIGGKTTGLVTVFNAVTIAGTVADVTAALVTPATLVAAATASVVITGGAITVSQANTISATTSGAVTATLSDSLANLAALSDQTVNAYAINVTTVGTIKATDLMTLHARTSGLVTVNAVNITGTAADLTALLVMPATPVKASTATITVEGDASVTQLNTIAAKTSGAVKATLSNSLANLAGLAETGNLYTVNINDPAGGAALSAAALSALGAKTTGVVKVISEVPVTGNATEVTAALVSADTLVLASTSPVSISGPVTVAQANAIAAKTSGVVTATISDTLAATLANLTETGNNYRITLGDPEGTALTASALSSLGGKTTGVVTVTNAVAITGTATELNAALFTAETLVIADKASVTVTGTLTAAQANAIAARTTGTVKATVSDTLANLGTLINGPGTLYSMTVTDSSVNTISATALSALGGLTTGEVRVANSVTITGSASEVTAALVTAHTLVLADTAKVAITGTTTVAQANAIAAKTSGVVTATISDTSAATLANLLETTNAYTTTLAGDPAWAADLLAIDKATTITVGAGAVPLIAGTQTEMEGFIRSTGITRGINFAATVVDPANRAVVGPATVTQVNEIDARNGIGIITAVISDRTVTALKTLTGKDNAYTITVIGAAVAAVDLFAIDTKTTLPVNATAVSTVTGTMANITSVINAPSSSMVINANANFVVSDSISVATANTLNGLGTGLITATINPGLASDLVLLSADGSVNAYAIAVSGSGQTKAADLIAIDLTTSVPVNATAVGVITGDRGTLMSLFAASDAGTISNLRSTAVKLINGDMTGALVEDFSLIAQQTTGKVSAGPFDFSKFIEHKGVHRVITNLASGDSFSTNLSFINTTSTTVKATLDGGPGLTWNYNPALGELQLEISDDGFYSSFSTYLMLSVPSVTYLNGVFTMG